MAYSARFYRTNGSTILDRLPIYFIDALHCEWQQKADFYRPIIDELDTPFTNAVKQEWAWSAYAARLQQRIHEPVFDETFSLADIYEEGKAFPSLRPQRARPFATPSECVLDSRW